MATSYYCHLQFPDVVASTVSTNSSSVVELGQCMVQQYWCIIPTSLLIVLKDISAWSVLLNPKYYCTVQILFHIIFTTKVISNLLCKTFYWPMYSDASTSLMQSITVLFISSAVVIVWSVITRSKHEAWRSDDNHRWACEIQILIMYSIVQWTLCSNWCTWFQKYYELIGAVTQLQVLFVMSPVIEFHLDRLVAVIVLCVYACMCVYVCVHVCVCACVHMHYACMCVPVCVHAFMCFYL